MLELGKAGPTGGSKKDHNPYYLTPFSIFFLEDLVDASGFLQLCEFEHPKETGVFFQQEAITREWWREDEARDPWKFWPCVWTNRLKMKEV
jgi:hypothetical protein